MLWTLVMLAGLAQAEPRLGAGVVLGDPTGLSLGWRGSAWSGAQAGIGIDDGRLDVSADYLQSIAVLEPAKRFQMPLYVGAGAGFATAEKGFFGKPGGITVRVPVGAAILFDRVPVELFAQVVPSIRVVPGTAYGLDVGLGGRYYF